MQKKISTRIPFNKPTLVGKELDYLQDACQRNHLAGDGFYTQKCHKLLEEYMNSPKVLLTHSCTAALEMSALIYKIGPGDEVIMPSYTFVSTANAFVLRGAKPVFIDIKEDDLNMDENLLEKAITSRTKAIIPVHYAGVSCAMTEILQIASHYKIPVIEDAAQGLGSLYKGKSLGSLGQLGTLSFHETKNCISGEGGALIINDETLITAAEISREKGTNRSQFYKGLVDKYTWVDIGSSYLPSELIAAFLFAQLERFKEITLNRKETYSFYYEGLLPLQEKGHITLPKMQNEESYNAHLFYLLANSGDKRDQLLNYLRDKKIIAPFHYIPLHTSPMGKKFHTGEPLPITESMSSRLLRLPLYYNISKEKQIKVIEKIHSFYNN